MLAALLLLSSAAVQASIQACAANVPYPPFFYFSAGETKQEGLALHLLRAASTILAQPLRVQVLPWRRCLKLAELGMIDIVLNVPTAQIDPEPYLVTEPYAQLRSAYYVSRKFWPGGIHISNLADLKRYRICGLSGNIYDGYGLRRHPVDSGATSYASLIGKMHQGRCDLFLEKTQVVAGLAALDKQLSELFSSPDLIASELPEDSPIGLHYAISKKSASGGVLLKTLNEVIAAQASARTRQRASRAIPKPAVIAR